MATIDSKEFIDKIIANDGYFEGDPRVYRIVEYTNAWGNTTWGVTWTGDRNKDRYLVESDFIRNPKTIWLATEH